MILDFLLLATTCAASVHPATLAALVSTESRFDPYAINVNADVRAARFDNAAEAAKEAQRLIDAGYSVDLGLGQINSKNLDSLGMSVEDAFNPCLNLQTSAHILSSNFVQAVKRSGDSQRALADALSAYNSGNFQRGYANGYVERVNAQHEKLKNNNFTVPAIEALPTAAASASASAAPGALPPVRLGGHATDQAPPDPTSTDIFRRGAARDVFRRNDDRFSFSSE